MNKVRRNSPLVYFHALLHVTMILHIEKGCITWCEVYDDKSRCKANSQQDNIGEASVYGGTD